jgi:putative transposase
MLKRRSSTQLALDLRPRRRDGKLCKKAGRPEIHDASLRHRARPRHARNTPLHITLKAREQLPSFREQVLMKALIHAVRMTRREGFRIVEFSIQSDHIHLIVEADDKEKLARGMKSFTVRAYRLFNAVLGRRGPVWNGQRYHRRDLKTPKQVRNALVYCLNNFRKHRPNASDSAVDAASSGPWFRGWRDGPAPKPDRPTALPETYLLREGWLKWGAIPTNESPKEAMQPMHNVAS